MFNIFSWQHIVTLAVIALVVVGPKDLPHFLRRTANWVMKGRSMISSLCQDFLAATRTTELDGLRAELNALKRQHPLSSLQDRLPQTLISGRPTRG
jgi:sec-independent protein translocase protein TatB